MAGRGRGLPIFVVDAFAERPFSGNPAAVCLLAAWPDEALLLAVAGELNLSETAFLVGGGGDYQIRWFTPTREVDLIGHATLAAGLVVLDQLEPGRGSVIFRSGIETLRVERDSRLLAMDFPALPSITVPHEATLAAALGHRPVEVRAGKHYMAIFERHSDVAALAPDMVAVAALDLPAVIATAPAAEPGIDFVSRFFAPANGVPEDPVSGVAHLVLVPYWAERLGKKRLVARQLSRRGGVVIGRDRGHRVTLLGTAILVAEGRLYP
ncbi:MAG TPA: PhzF family phenazine biosynthesis protein [Stellaceae bacterium]|jgi:PhzF family phenazine biosynthesis protein